MQNLASVVLGLYPDLVNHFQSLSNLVVMPFLRLNKLPNLILLQINNFDFQKCILFVVFSKLCVEPFELLFTAPKILNDFRTLYLDVLDFLLVILNLGLKLLKLLTQIFARLFLEMEERSLYEGQTVVLNLFIVS